MKIKTSFAIVFLFSFSLVLATSIQIDRTEYTQGEILTATIQECPSGSVLQIYNSNIPVPDLIYVSQGERQWQATYNTNSDSSDGRYLLFASCEDGTVIQQAFCVDAPGCIATEEEEEEEEMSGNATSSSSQGSGGGGCTRRWSCPNQWNYCNATLQQSKSCTDLNRCNRQKLTKIEVQSCAACEESWICTPWNACQNGQHTRNCVDEHACRTIMQKPSFQKSCTAAASGPVPARIEPQLPVMQQSLPSSTVSWWDKHKVWFIAVPFLIIAIVLLILGARHLLKSRPVEYNVDELKAWVRKEQQMGTSVKDIKEILRQHTRWSAGEVEGVLGKLGQNK